MDDKPETSTAQLAAIDLATLTPLMQSALGSETAEVIDWKCEQLHSGAGVGSAIYRFSGSGRDRGQIVRWSLILKTLCPQVPGDDPSAWNYYRREGDAYQSGWLDDLPGGLAAPRCLGVVELPDGTCWIWLEDVADEIGVHWPLEHYGVVARHAGRFNGAYLAGWRQPSGPWLSSGWLRRNIESSAAALPLLRDSLDNALVRRWLSGGDSDTYFQLWEERGRYLDALDRLPQTLCHLDLFRRNLFARRTTDGDHQTLAVDWAFAGRGALGEELVPLILGSLLFYEVELDQARALEEVVFEGYLEGLQDAGWRGDAWQVRLGYAAAASLRYQFNDVGRWLTLALDERLHPIVLQMWGRSMGEILDQAARVGRFSYRLAQEARELINALQ